MARKRSNDNNTLKKPRLALGLIFLISIWAVSFFNLTQLYPQVFLVSNIALAGDEAAILESGIRMTTTLPVKPKQTSDALSTVTDTTILPLSGPPWFQEYTQWHATTLQTINATNWQNYKYLILRCVSGDAKCGGAADRLASLPVMVYMAYQSQRLLLIYWSRPHALEEFLLPNGLNWTVPNCLRKPLQVETTRGLFRWNDKRMQDFNASYHKAQVIRIMRLFYINHYYDRHFETANHTLLDVYPAIWNTLFRPSPGVQARLDDTLQQLHLEPKHYAAAHVRSVYINNRTHDRSEMENAVRCAHSHSQQQHHPKIYVASDSIASVQVARDYAISHKYTIVSRPHDHPVLHLDRGRHFLVTNADWKDRPPSDFYDTFVDVYLLSYANVIALGAGGYAQWGAYIGGVPIVKHRKTRC